MTQPARPEWRGRSSARYYGDRCHDCHENVIKWQGSRWTVHVVTMTAPRRRRLFVNGLLLVTGVALPGPSPRASTGTPPVWRRLPDMPTARTGPAMFASGGRLYAIGGQNQSRFVAMNEVYDTVTSAWSSAPPIRLGRTFSATNSAAIDGVLYVIAGNPRGYCTNASDAFDVAGGRWHLLPGAPVARCHAAAVAASGRVFVIGGWNTSSTVRFTTVDVYDPRTNAWSHDTPLPRPRGSMAAGVVGRSIYLAGGWTPDSPASSDVDSYDIDHRRWTTRTRMPTDRGGAAAAVLDGRLYVIGGQRVVGGHVVFTNAVESYDPATNRWRIEPPLPVSIAYASAAVVGGTIYVAGGATEDGTILSSVFAFTPGTPR